VCAAQNGSVEKECTGPGACSLDHCSACLFSTADSNMLSSRIWPLLRLSRHRDLTSPLGEVPASSAVSSVVAPAALGTPALPPSWQGPCAESDCGQGVKSAAL